MVKQERYIQQKCREYIHRSELGLLPETRFAIADVKVTKQPSFGLFNVAGYWRRKYLGKVEDQGGYLLTNLTSSQEAIAGFKCRSGIEAMFKNCKTGGYNLEKIHTNNQRLTTLILLIAIAYSCAPPTGQKNPEYGNSKICG
jgi:hypothetical protein